MSFEWGGENDSNDESFGDRPVELGDDGKWQDVQTVAPPPQPRAAAPARPAAPPPPPANTHSSTQEVEYEDEEEAEEDVSDILANAKRRLAQGSLYEMLMNNNLFQDLDIDPKAVRNVEREVKAFARERMEIMLGMRQEAQPQAEVISGNPFNDLEVQTLKALASAATQGATQSPEAQTFTAERVAPRKSSLTPIGQSAPARKPVPAPVKPKPLPKAPAQPIQRKRLNNAAVEQGLIEEGVEREFIEEAKNQLAKDTYKPIDKPLHELSEEELRQRHEAGKQRLGKQVRSTGALPMPDQESINAHMSNRAAVAAANPQMQSLMNLLTKKQ